MTSKVQLGVRLFSFRNLYPLDEAFRRIAAFGVTGFDVTASQTVAQYPWPTESYIESFKDLYRKHGLELLSYDGNIDLGIRPDRHLTDEEMFFNARNDVLAAARFGARFHRVQWHLPPHVLERLAPYCEMLGIRAGIEIHSPLKPGSPVIQEYVRMFERVKSPWIGLIPDFGAFASKPRREQVLQAQREGIAQETIDRVIAGVLAGVHPTVAAAAVEAAGGGEKELRFLGRMYHSGFGTPDFEGLKRILPYSFHFHGKFYSFDEDGNDSCIPLETLLPLIRDSGYDGWITSEYEGHMDGTETDPAEMVGRQLALYRRILAG